VANKQGGIMPQKLFVKTTDEEGKSGLKEVHIIRSWQESSGLQLYLHKNGIYGYKDESPVMKVREFDIIGDPIQKKAALAWWNRAGKKLSEEFYKKRDEEIEKGLGYMPVIEGDDSNLDAAQYIRRLISDRSKKAWSEPSTWFDWFKEGRPEWWGSANLIEIGHYRYKKMDLENESITNIDENEPGEDNEPDEEKTDGF
jgi:hypothetical protein